ncbi:uncharacterized protein LOC103494348 [Cucumis melo]|uniref:Uncharacterized protein LOC103494348 n=1 Tax=Cucumis melo TaxID=3656 RepID=A0A1S3BWW1_CUCME|nr:uncharacterized protein LOC103494348 [Cucumis melo]
MGLRPKYESVRAALLHRNPLPSLDADIQEILFKEKRVSIVFSLSSNVALDTTHLRQANVISSKSTALAVTPDTSWLLDSACCNHMTSGISLLSSHISVQSLPPVHFADGNHMSISHIDTDSQIGQVIGTGRKMGRSFELTSLQHSPVFPAISTLVTDNTIFQWHLRLGHASSDKLRSLASTGILNNVSKFSTFDCLNCKLAKQPALSFPNSASLCDKRFGLIHSDI